MLTDAQREKQRNIYFWLEAIASLVFGVAHIIMSQKTTSCNHDDSIGLNIQDWLLGLGLFELLRISLAFLCSHALESCIQIPQINCICLICLIIEYLLWLVWEALGGIILFRSNLDCIQAGKLIALYTLIMWCIRFYLLKPKLKYLVKEIAVFE
jgi:hypothetical protein